MDDSTAVITTSTTVLLKESPTLRRRNSISTTSVVVVEPNKLNGAATPPVRTTSLELVSLNSPFCSYTSLRDMLPSPNSAYINSPTASSAVNSGYEISIRNRLVKQAAWAYLQPMSSSTDSSSAPHFLRRLCHRLSSAASPLAACFSFLYHHLVPRFTRIFHRILHALRGQAST